MTLHTRYIYVTAYRAFTKVLEVSRQAQRLVFQGYVLGGRGRRRDLRDLNAGKKRGKLGFKKLSPQALILNARELGGHRGGRRPA